MQKFNVDTLRKTEFMLKWFADEPYHVMLDSITKMLNQKIAGTSIESFEATSEPDWLTGFLPVNNDAEKQTVTRAGCAFLFMMDVRVNGAVQQLTGTYTWVANDIEQGVHMRQKTWLDIDKDLSHTGIDGTLKTRLFL